MLVSHLHCDGYRLAAEIAEQNNIDREDVINQVCAYLNVGDGNIAIPVYFQELLREYGINPIAKYIYDILVTYVNEPIGKVYIDF